MITKLILSGSFDFGDPATALVPLHSRGVDHGWIEKRAAHGIFKIELQKLADAGGKKGHSVFHVIAVGDEERYGDNRNHDAFAGCDNKTAHTRFKTDGHVFQHHKNWNAQLKTGEVLATAYNETMARIELLIALDHNKYAADELKAWETGDENLAVSMGSKQKFDVCSHCGHKAPTAKDHCDHIKTKLGQVLEDGSKIYMKNPDPGYFDISTVWKPADRIGYALAKVASQNGELGGHDLAELYGIREWSSVKQATLIRLAELEKRFAGVGKPAQGMGPAKLSDRAVSQLKQAAARHGVDSLLARLHGQGQLLGYEDFVEVVVGQSKLASAGRPNLTGGFGRLLGDWTEVTSLDGDGAGRMWLGDETERELREKTAMAGSYADSRVLRQSIVLPSVKVAAADDAVTHGLGDFYLHYKLAFAGHPNNRDNQSLLAALALSNVLPV